MEPIIPVSREAGDYSFDMLSWSRDAPQFSKFENTYSNFLICIEEDELRAAGANQWPTLCCGAKDSLCLVRVSPNNKNLEPRHFLPCEYLKGKLDPAVIPPRVLKTEVERVDCRSVHTRPIQCADSLYDSSTHNSILYTVDSLNRVAIHRMSSVEDSPKKVGFFSNIQSSSIAYSRSTRIEGRSSIALDKSCGRVATCVTAGFWEKIVDVYVDGQITSSFGTVFEPSQLKFMDNGLLVVVEGNDFLIWDLRLPSFKNNSCIRRYHVSGASRLSALATKGDCTVAVGGDDRCISVYDIRRGGPKYKLNKCLKYEVNFVALVDDDACIMGNRDCELACHHFDDSSRILNWTSPNADAKWVGFAHSPKFSDSIFALAAASNKIYRWKNIQLN